MRREHPRIRTVSTPLGAQLEDPRGRSSAYIPTGRAVRIDQLELWECVLAGFDLVAVLDLVETIGRALLPTANGFHYFTLNAGTAPPFSMNVHLPSAHTRFSISIRFNWTYCSGDRPIACR